jgi:hypothetical protein
MSGRAWPPTGAVTGVGESRGGGYGARMSSEPLPEALARLVATLRSMGFVLERDDDAPSLGNRIVELAAPDRPAGRGVRLIQDRGLWMAEIELAGDWRLPYEVLRALDGGKFASRAMGHEERADTVLVALERLPTDDAGLDELRRRLQEFDAEYLRGMGVDPPG